MDKHDLCVKSVSVTFILAPFCATLSFRNINCCSGSDKLPDRRLLSGEKVISVSVNHFFFAHLLLNLTESPLLHFHPFSAAVPPRLYQQTQLREGRFRRGFCQARGPPLYDCTVHVYRSTKRSL